MSRINVGLAQTNPVVGDFIYNQEQILALCDKAHRSELDLVIFGELALCGYPLGDLSYRQDVVVASERSLSSLAEQSIRFPGLTILVGHVSLAKNKRDPRQSADAIAHNSASFIRDGKILGTYHKKRLPNYDVFDDWRNFIPGDSNLIVEIKGSKVGVAICEDIWDPKISSSEFFNKQSVDLIAVLNGSPYTRNKQETRIRVASEFAQGTAIAYVNLCGGQDELVFDGGSFMLESRGHKILESGMETGLNSDTIRPVAESEHKTLWQVLVTGLRDYLNKTGQSKVILGLSGGIDSALCAAIASEAIGSENVLGVALPSRYSSAHSISDAKAVAKSLGIEYREISIEGPHAAFEKELALSDLAKENIQARIRAVILMGISNSEGYLLLSTGNKSEVAVGYSTIYGDSAGGFAPIKDVFKTDVWALSRWLNRSSGKELIPENSISKAPSAELRPGQVDQDSLPDYEVLDQVLKHLIEEVRSIDEIVTLGFDRELIERIDQMVRNAEWKRSQGAIGTKTTEVSFGKGRRVPLTTRFRTA
ncbi:MAG: NAD+ synthase [Aquiluna sp.]|nr:NAD+ synthase [Aquiluna sp.]